MLLALDPTSYLDHLTARFEPGWKTSIASDPLDPRKEAHIVGHKQIAVPLKLLRAAQSELETAALVAHAIAHFRLQMQPKNGRPAVFLIPSDHMPLAAIPLV